MNITLLAEFDPPPLFDKAFKKDKTHILHYNHYHYPQGIHKVVGGFNFPRRILAPWNLKDFGD